MAAYLSVATTTITGTAQNVVTGARSGDTYELQSNGISFWVSTIGTASAAGAGCVFVPQLGYVEIRVHEDSSSISVIRGGSTNGGVTVSLVSP